jgi:hypothetical protein
MAKAYDYVVTLKQRSFHLFDWVNQLLLFLSLVVFSYTAYRYEEPRTFYIVIAAATLAYWFYCNLQSKKEDHIVYYRLALVIASIGWFKAEFGNPWIGGLMLIVAFLERQVKFPQEIGFNEEGIAFNSFPKKLFSWGEVSNVILKDGLLTVDLVNNKLVQKEIESGIVPALEKEFNDFCAANLYNKQQQAIKL